MEAKSSQAPIGPQVQPAGQVTVFKADKVASQSLSLPHGSVKTILAGFIMLFLVGGVGVGVYLVGQQQQLKSKASGTEIPQNIKSVVPAKDINPQSTRSATPAAVNQPASAAATLSGIVVPELESSSSGDEASGSALMDLDFNQDGSANSVDLSVLYSSWGTPKNELQKRADLNKDGNINGIDYSLFIKSFTISN